MAVRFAPSCFVALVFSVLATMAVRCEQPNLLPNGGFEGKEPLKGWVVDFPDEQFYVGNAPYVKMAAADEAGGRRAVKIDLPPGIAGNQGGKIESVPVPVVPGGSYHIEVDCMTWDFGAKIHAEVWCADPKPDQKKTIFRRAAKDGRPALIATYRAQVPSPPGNSKQWKTASRNFKVPETFTVDGKEVKPEFISIKVVVYAATQAAGKSYFSNFRLTRVDSEKTETKHP